ncbi:hypothetical protein Tco_0415606 [Tanacetum coccineum]
MLDPMNESGNPTEVKIVRFQWIKKKSQELIQEKDDNITGTNYILCASGNVDDIIFGSTKKSLCMKFEKMMHKKFQMSSMGELTFFILLGLAMKKNGRWKLFYYQIKTKSHDWITDVSYYDSSRPDIMFIVYACARYQVNLKVSHLQAVKRIFRYLKGQPILGLWYPKDSPFNLVAYTDSGYARASLDRKSTIEGCQFLGCRLILCQCKKQIVVANSTTKADYIAASNCYGQVLWIQNQLMDYGYNFMQTKIHIDNESTICIVKNPVFHSKTKHIEIRHHFIRDSNKKKLIQMIKIHTDQNVVDLLTKAFDVSELEEEEERLIRQKEEEDNIALIESWDNTQAMMDTDYQMAQQLQAKEQEHLSIKEKLKLLDDDQEEARMKELMNIVPDEEEVAV